MLGMISVFLNLPRPDLWPRMWSWRMFCVHLRKKWNLLFWGEMSYRYQLGLTGPLYHLKFMFPCWFYVWLIYPSVWVGYAAKSLQSCLTLYDPIEGSPPGSPVPGIPGKNTGVGCHFLLQYMKVKSEREVAQSYPTPSDPMDCSLPGSSIHGIFQARVLEWGAIAFSGVGYSLPLLLCYC